MEPRIQRLVVESAGRIRRSSQSGHGNGPALAGPGRVPAGGGGQAAHWQRAPASWHFMHFWQVVVAWAAMMFAFFLEQFVLMSSLSVI